jgi:hypothetical protein
MSEPGWRIWGEAYQRGEEWALAAWRAWANEPVVKRSPLFPEHDWSVDRQECRRCLLTAADMAVNGYQACMSDDEIAVAKSKAAALIASLYRVPR